MFSGCTSLATAPELPATTLASSCYCAMFADCTSLTTAPVLSPTTLANSCYRAMFRNCTSLTTAPELPATTLASNCYQYMFSGCTSLTTAPDLLAPTLVSECYEEMFCNCSSLNYIKCMATSVTTGTIDWISGVSATGMFVKDRDTKDWKDGSYSNNGIPFGWNVFDQYDIQPLTFVALGSGTFKLSGNSVQYSTNSGATWNTLASNTNSPTITAGNTIMWKGTITPTTNKGVGTFSSTGNFEVKGNPMSLLYGDNFIGSKSLNGKAYAFACMFSGVTTLVMADKIGLPATTLEQHCYDTMFKGCTSLTTTPQLPATTLEQYCYDTMFADCTSLTTAPELPATTLATWCYHRMFDGCTSLNRAPKLRALTLANYCYTQMFKGCTSLTRAPKLPAVTLKEDCYEYMFYGCTSLNYIKCLATDISATNCTTNWVNGVAAIGTFVKDESMTSWTIGVNGIPTGWSSQGFDYKHEPLTFVALESGTFTVNSNDVNYSLDNGVTWSTLTAGSTSPTIPIDGTIMWKATLTPDPTDRFGVIRFRSSGIFEVEGNPMSLLYGDNFIGQTSLAGKTNAFRSMLGSCDKLIFAENLQLLATELAPYCYANMFYDCSGLTTTPELPASTMTASAYTSMFYGCRSLTTAPSLPATTLAVDCYNGMFYNCSSLVVAPSLPATALTKDCYNGMFGYCQSLTTAPSLPATTLAERCYSYMFIKCTRLTTAPSLPATTLARYCYCAMFDDCSSLTTAPALRTTTLAEGCYQYMFDHCTSLATAPELPATTLTIWCYDHMFQFCTSLTTAPVLSATTLTEHCYYEMFYYCTSLNYVKCLATDISASQCTYNWLGAVASRGTFIKNPSMTSWTTSYNGIPYNWTVQDAT